VEEETDAAHPEARAAAAAPDADRRLEGPARRRVRDARNYGAIRRNSARNSLTLHPSILRYAKWAWAKNGFDFKSEEKKTAETAAAVGALLVELEGLLRGGGEGGGAPTLNAWGFTMDDLLLLPLLRNLTCCKAIEWPPTARAYVEQVEALGVATYFAHAI
jgi:hypothetical protein